MTTPEMDHAAWRQLFEDNPANAVVLTPGDWVILAVTDGFLKTTGRTRESLIGRVVFDVFPDPPGDETADGTATLRASLERVVATRARDAIPPQRYPVEINGRFEERFWSTVSAPVLSARGEVVAVIHRTEDVTEIIRMRTDSGGDETQINPSERARLESTALLRLAGRVGRIGGWAVDVASSTVHWSDEMFDILEYPADGVPSLDGSLDRYAPASRAAVTAAMAATIASGRSFDLELEIESFRGRWLTVRAVGEAVRDEAGTVVRVIGAFQDITDLKVAERSAREAGARLADALEQMPTALYMLDRSWRFTYLNREAELLLERPREELVGTMIWDAFPEARDYPVYTTYRETMEERESRTVEFFYPPLQHWFDVTSHPSPEGIIVYFRVVDDRKAAEEERRASAEWMAEQAALLNETSDAIIVRDLTHRVLFWNRGAELLYGWTAPEAIGEVMVQAGYPDVAIFEAAMAEVLTRGEWAGELLQRRRGGSPITVFSRWTLRRDANGQPTSVLVIDSDVTERRKLERQFLRSQRLESLGTLAGGIAHDLNNALAPILMGVDYLRDEPSAAERAATLDALEASARRGAAMVRQVLTFARGIEGERRPLPVPILLGEVAKFAEETFLKEVEVVREVAADVPPVLGDATQLHQVLINLCVNARDAMPMGGQLTLAARRQLVSDGEADTPHELRAGQYVVLEVLDTGVGVPAEVLDRIFEPFFTTKALGEGTGLGLSTSKSIVEAHGGAIRIASTEGTGTAVSVWLPVAEEGKTSITPPTHTLPHGNGELLLVVDDEPAVRDITRRTLERFGYRVVTAGGAEEALHAFRGGREDFAVVITDMMMPGMDGAALIAELRRLDPALRVIAVSGLQGQGAGARSQLPAGVHFLAKPFATAELLELVQTVVASSQG